MNKLQEIVEHKRREVAFLKDRCSVEYLESVACIRQPSPALVGALRAAPMGLIAEVKHRSPSVGVIREPFEPRRIAAAYREGGAQAISCLVDETYFGGGIVTLSKVRDATRLPVLYKEFVVDAWQVWQAASLGCSAVLLIVAALSAEELAALAAVCAQAGLDALVEVHDGGELEQAVEAGATFIGVNNRDLRTFETSLERSLELAERMPEGVTRVSESGIASAEDVFRLKEAGYHGVLVGEHLLRQDDLAGAVRSLMGAAWASR